MVKAKQNNPSDFADLRAAFGVVADIIGMNGRIAITRSAVKLGGVPRQDWPRISAKARAHSDMIRYLMTGQGQREKYRDIDEVVVSVLASRDSETGERCFQTTLILVRGRSVIEKFLTVSGADPEWKKKIGDFVDWNRIPGIIAAAEGNNQRAMIGLVLQLAGIGRGRLKMIEAEIPEEIDEAAQSVRGADWLKAGLLRFKSSAGEALWYLMRIRAVHERMIRTKKQGYYTSMAFATMIAADFTTEEISRVAEMSEDLVERLLPREGRNDDDPGKYDILGGNFRMLDFTPGTTRRICADRVWKGAAIYTRMLDRRIRVGAEAREAIGNGDDLVSVSQSLRLARRDLVRVLSVSQSAAIEERERFVSAIIDPEMVRRMILGKS